MKKFLTLALALFMVFSFAACGGESAPGADDPGDGGQNVNADVEIPANFEEVVIVDNEYALVKITDIYNDETWGYTLKAEMENRSSDTTYMFSVDAAFINGVDASPLFAVDIAPGKKATEGISFFEDVAYGNDIGKYTDIELDFSISDSEDWLADYVVETTANIYPYGKENAVRFERAPQPSDKTVVDTEEVTVIFTGCEEDPLWGYTANFFLINKSDMEVMFSSEEASVNGYMTEPLYIVTLKSGKCAFSQMYLDDGVFEDNGITDVEEFEFRLQVSDWENFDENFMSEEYFVDEVITVNP